MTFSFWQKWMVVVGLYHVVFGLLLAFFHQTALMDVLLGQYLDPVFWHDQGISQAAVHYKNFSSAVLGALVASWGMLIAFIANYPFKFREKWAWQSIAAAVTLWFIVDTGFSLYYRVSINAVFNLLTLALFLLPLLFTWKDFFRRPDN